MGRARATRWPMVATAAQYDAWCTLLALPDPPDLRRGRHYTQTGTLDRERIKADLARAYAFRRLHERGRDVSHIVSVRRFRILQGGKRA